MKSRDLFKRAIKTRIENGKDVVVFVIGDVGIGKTTLTAGLCQSIDPHFNEETWQNYYSMADTADFSKKLVADPGYDGAVLIYDELGWGAGKGSYLERLTIALNQIMELRRVKKRVIFFVFPYLSEIVKGMRHRAHYVLDVRNRDSKRNTYRCWVNKVWVEHYKGKHARVRCRWKINKKTVFLDGPLGLRLPVYPRRRVFGTMIVQGVPESFRKKMDDYGSVRKTEGMKVSAEKTEVASHDKDWIAEAKKNVIAEPLAYVKVYNKMPLWNKRAIVSKHPNLTRRGLDEVMGFLESEQRELLIKTTALLSKNVETQRIPPAGKNKQKRESADKATSSPGGGGTMLINVDSSDGEG